MNNEKHIESEVRKTMDVLDQLKRVDGNPYLYTRLKVRLAAETEIPGHPRSLAWQAVLSALVLVLNGFFLYQQWQGPARGTDLPEALANEWGLDKSAETYLLTSN